MCASPHTRAHTHMRARTHFQLPGKSTTKYTEQTLLPTALPMQYSSLLCAAWSHPTPPAALGVSNTSDAS